MNYLALARRATESMTDLNLQGPMGRAEAVPGTKETNLTKKPSSILTPEQAEDLKDEIIAVATAESSQFDRPLYNRLMARWLAHEAAERESAEAQSADPTSDSRLS